MLDSRENIPNQLVQAALQYHARGWSVLPVRGAADLHNPKAPALAWAPLQRRCASAQELEDWFTSGLAGGLGLVCGRVSRLTVLDLDDAEAATAFAQCCPQLLDTLTVRSGGRGQPHYYFEVPDAVQLRGARAPGVDLQFEGAYVVAAPTCIGEQRWSVVYETTPLRLDQGSADELMRFVELWRLRSAGGPAAALEPQENAAPLSLTEVALQGWYRKLARRGGRNRALFRAASLARDSGWSQARANSALVMAHVAQPPTSFHSAETPTQREAEARRTIGSAWRQPRQALRRSRPPQRGLPNGVREAMLAGGQTAALRVLDGLLLVGVQAGRLVSERMLCQLLGVFHIGRRSVQQGLRARLPDGARIFATPRNPPASAADAAVAQAGQQKKCFSVRGAERVKKGRPPRLYRVPALTRLLARLRLKDGGSDPLTLRDLRSARAYRCALHRALIERRPGRYSRRWLGERLGVSIWTSRRYDQGAGLCVQARYETQLLDEAGVAYLPQRRGAADGRFLQGEDGRRWPALQGLARKLLRSCRRLWFVCQGWNDYAVLRETSLSPQAASPQGRSDRLRVPRRAAALPGAAENPDAAWEASVTGVTVTVECETIHKQYEAAPVFADVAAAAAVAPNANYWHCSRCERGRFAVAAPATCNTCGSDALERVPPQIWRDAQRCRDWWRERQDESTEESEGEMVARPEPLTQDLALLQSLCAATRACGPQHALAHETARQLLLEHGAVALRRVLRLLQRRRDIRNPAGFVVSLLRGSRSAARQPQLSQEEWLAALQASPWADFIEA